jgi:hypothetical protein
MKGANQLYLEYLLGAVNVIQIVDWAVQLLTSTDPLSNHLNVISLAELNGTNAVDWNNDPGDTLGAIVKAYYGDFRIPSIETEIYAKACLREICADLLVGKPLQSNFFAVLNNIHRLFDNPAWLGKLYVLCHQSIFCTTQENFECDLKNEIKTRLTQL